VAAVAAWAQAGPTSEQFLSLVPMAAASLVVLVVLPPLQWCWIRLEVVVQFQHHMELDHFGVVAPLAVPVVLPPVVPEAAPEAAVQHLLLEALLPVIAPAAPAPAQHLLPEALLPVVAVVAAPQQLQLEELLVVPALEPSPAPGHNKSSGRYLLLPS